ncbi:MAG: alkaline phosphatase family protein [Armatimonadetes bacterium]|nr:alkaline phosphatase family protein [Armatimonadota bacterium]
MRLVAGLILVMLALLLVGCTHAADSPLSVVFIGWDGSQRAHVQEMLQRNELPTLAALSAEGTLVEVDVNNGATDTKAGWTQILTGYKPEVTGVYDNSHFQPVPQGYSVFERLEQHFGPENIATLAVVGKKNHIGKAAPQRIPLADLEQRIARAEERQNRKQVNRLKRLAAQAVEENGEKVVPVPGEPWYLAQNAVDLFENGLGANEKVGARALEELEKHKGDRLFFFIHFQEPDHAGHQHGENSQEYTDALKDDDAWTARIIEKLKALGRYETTLVYVVVDHGFDEGKTGHSYAPYVFVGTNDTTFVRRQGDRADIAAHVLKRFGVDLAAINPPLDGIPYDQEAPERRAPEVKPTAPQ